METCEYIHCKNEPVYICPCPTKDSAFCADHIKSHVREQGYHGKVSDNFIGISEGEKVNIALQCEAGLIELKKIKEKISLEANKAMKIIIEATVSNYEYIKYEEDIFKEILEFLSINNKIIKRKEYSPKDQKIIDSMKNPQHILDTLKSKEKDMIAKVNYKSDEDINIIIRNCSDKIEEMKQEMKQEIEKKNSDMTEKLENYKKSAITCIEHYINQIGLLINNFGIKVSPEYINDEFIRENMGEFNISEKLNNYKTLNFPKHFYDETYKSRYLGFFDDKTKVFNIVDCPEERLSKIDINIETPLWTWAGWCELPDNRMIYYSGHDTINNIYPITIYEFNFESPQNFITLEIDKSKVKGKGYTGSLGYYNNCFYSFGGYTLAGYLKDSGMFDLQTKEWSDLEPLPEVCGHNSCITVTDKLAVIGYNPTKIFIYDTIKKNYESQGNFPLAHKFIAKGDSKIIIFENNKIHETKEGEYNFIQVNGNSGISGCALISYVIRYKLYLYFALQNRRLYKFNLITKIVQDLKAL
ncbi:hypothetical protein SteCoe_18879 [Stentor coeruleus]|uniref:Uncharacterized protein n=1 Tax=Stentor coeruleus TaxID=5963 RepID=A0A1R2BVB7_9CILI|nr:hypothetical protein SteCoe_18879 [Stentor coeruleus]